MSTVEEQIKSRLTTHSGTNALVAGRIYPIKLIQKPTYPAITYFRVTTERNSAMGADIADVRAQFQVSAWDTSYSGVKALAAQVRDALERYGVVGAYATIQDTYFLNEVDLYDDDALIYQVACTFEVNYLE